MSRGAASRPPIELPGMNSCSQQISFSLSVCTVSQICYLSLLCVGYSTKKPELRSMTWAFSKFKTKKRLELLQSSTMPDNIKDRSHSDAGSLKLDGSGLPLIPQPTSSPIDPLNYPNVCFSTWHYNIGSTENADTRSGWNISSLYKCLFLRLYQY